MGPFDKAALVQVMAWHWTGDKLFTDTYMHQQGPISHRVCELMIQILLQQMLFWHEK